MPADMPPPGHPAFDDDAPVTSIDLVRAKKQLPAGPGSGWESSLVYEAKGRGEAKEIVLAGSPGNLTLLLVNEPAWAGCLGYDQFAEREVWLRQPPPLPGLATPQPGEVRDEHDTFVQQWFHAKRQVFVGSTTVAVMAAARSNGFHPVRDYLRSLEWKGVPRLNKLLPHYFGSPDSVYTQQIGRRWMVSAVARVMQPGCKVDTMLVIEGAQGKRKSSALEALVGKSWFADTKLDLGKVDAYQALRGKWVIEMAELDALKNQEVTRIKGFLTSGSDNYRPSYGKRARDFPRQTIFAGSTNEEKYLRDKTGNRRFWPVAAGTIRIDELARDRDQLWAEAFQAYEGGQQWWLDSDELEAAAEDAQAERMVDEDGWTSLVRQWLEKLYSPAGLPNLPGLEDVNPEVGITTTQVLLGAIGCRKDGIGQSETTRIGHVLRSLNHVSRRVTVGGEREWRYFRVGGR